MNVQPDAQVKLRMPQELRDWLRQQARHNLRKLGAEIVHRLVESREGASRSGVQQ